jgi:type IV pilus assembly protein PilA
MEQIQKRLEKFKQKQKGFTLVELIVVIAIIGILAGVLLPKYFGFTDQARKAAAFSDAKNIQSTAEAYYSNYGVWPYVTTNGKTATKGTNNAGTANAATSQLSVNTLVTVSTQIDCPVFQGMINAGTTATVFSTDGSFTYISATGYEVDCDSNGTLTQIN